MRLWHQDGGGVSVLSGAFEGRQRDAGVIRI
jgi:hypothetical protein